MRYTGLWVATGAVAAAEKFEEGLVPTVNSMHKWRQMIRTCKQLQTESTSEVIQPN